jgi:hypothetical protein
MSKGDCIEKGVCQLHEVEVERRKYNSKLLDRIPTILSWMNFMKGATIMLALVLSASFIYSRDISAEAKERDARIDQRIESHTDQINNLIRLLAVETEKNKNMLKAIDKLSRDIRALIAHDASHHPEAKTSRESYEGMP